MTANENKNLEELLNGCVDGDLNERQTVELQRLMHHNPEILKRLDELKRCKELVGAMPVTHAPENIFDNIKASLERRSLLEQFENKSNHKLGAVFLFARRLTSVAAMIGLVAVLGFMVYYVVKPHGKVQNVAINTEWSTAKPQASKLKAVGKLNEAVVTAPAKASKAADSPMRMELELTSDQYIAVTSYIYRSIILENGLLDSTNIDRQTDKSTYSFVCGRARMNNVLDELQSIWDKFNGAKLSLGSSQTSQWAAVIDGVNAEQVMQIITQRSEQDQIKLANDFASLNHLNEQVPENALAAVDANTVSVIKPVLASGEMPKAEKEPANIEKIKLTIIVHGR